MAMMDLASAAAPAVASATAPAVASATVPAMASAAALAMASAAAPAVASATVPSAATMASAHVQTPPLKFPYRSQTASMADDLIMPHSLGGEKASWKARSGRGAPSEMLNRDARSSRALRSRKKPSQAS